MGDSVGRVSLNISPSYRLVGDAFTVFNKIERIEITPGVTRILADGEFRFSCRVALKDADGETLCIPFLPMKVKHSFHVSLLSADPAFLNGEGRLEFQTTEQTGVVHIEIEAGGVKAIDESLHAVKGKLTAFTNPGEEVLIYDASNPKLCTSVFWTRPEVTVYARIMHEGGVFVDASPRKVRLTVYDTDHQTVKAEYVSDMVRGEAVFSKVSYYKRGSNLYFVLSAEGYDPVELRILKTHGT